MLHVRGRGPILQVPELLLVQTVSKQWRMFTCGKCDTKQDLPFRWGYDRGATAMRVEGTGKSWPPL